MRFKYLFILLIFISGSLLAQVVESNSYENIVTLNQKLFIEVENGDTNAISILIKRGANVNASTYEGVSPLMYAVEYADFDIVKLLIKYGANVNKSPYDGKSPLMSAAEQGLIEIGEMLILNKAKMEEKNKKGFSAIHYAIANENLYFTEMLLFYEDDIERKTKDGSTPLILACYYGDLDIVNLLLETGADIEAKDNGGYTSIMVASQNGYLEIVNSLLAYQANVNIENNYGHSALSYAVKNGQTELVNVLIENNANTELIIDNRYNLLYLADKYNHYDIKTILKENGVNNKNIFYFDKVFLNSGINFSSKDAMFHINGGVSESRKKIGVGLSYYKRFGYVPILELREDFISQYYENRSMIGFYMSKEFEFYEITDITKVGMVLTLEELFTYGKYKALNRKPKGSFVTSPAIGLYYRKGGIFTSFKYQFVKTRVDEFPPSRWLLNIGFDILIKRNLAKDKIINW